ncbi:MAG: ATP-dependent sacrificial sulfur transferase LarE, partial [Actinomycetota bacterium]
PRDLRSRGPSPFLAVRESAAVVATGLSLKLEELHRWFEDPGGVVVAYSGGTDSTLVAAVAGRVLGDRALAVTAASPSLPPGELGGARRVAAALGIRHRTVRTHETDKPEYLANGTDRCYHCKAELYDVLARIAVEERLPVVVSGANLDDLGDFRPGLRAAAELGVRHPLVEVGFAKSDVREAARELGIPTWDKPASACLSSRIAFGVMITLDELSKVGRAERLLKDLGFRQCRVRVHGDLARVEVELPDLPRLAEPGVRDRVVEGLRSLGYRYVTLDLEGFRSRSMPPEEGA